MQEHSLLWVPLLSVAILLFILNSLQMIYLHHLSESILANNPGLGHTPGNSAETLPGLSKVVLITLPLGWCFGILEAILLTAAYVLTAMLVAQCLKKLRPDLSIALTEMNAQRRRIFTFGLLLYASFFAFSMIINIPPVILAPIFIHPLHPSFIHLIRNISAFLTAIMVCYFMTPTAMRLLQSPESLPLSEITLRQGRIATVLAATVQLAISSLLPIAKSLFSIPPSSISLPTFGIEAVISLLSCLPFVPMFIVLVLLVDMDADDLSFVTSAE